MNKRSALTRVLAAIVLVLIIGAVAYFILTPSNPATQPQLSASSTPTSAAEPVAHPSPSAVATQPARQEFFSASPDTGSEPLQVSLSFGKQALINAGANLILDTGDGDKGSIDKFVTCGLQFCTSPHTYAAGTYDVSLTDGAGKTLQTQVITVQKPAGTLTVSPVKIGNGISFDLPAGWSYSPIKIGPGYYSEADPPTYSLKLYDETDTAVGDVACPAVPKGGEGEGPVPGTYQKRSFTEKGVVLTATYSENGGSDVAGPMVADKIISDVSAPDSSECYLMLYKKGVVTAALRTAGLEIYDSWK